MALIVVALIVIYFATKKPATKPIYIGGFASPWRFRVSETAWTNADVMSSFNSLVKETEETVTVTQYVSTDTSPLRDYFVIGAGAVPSGWTKGITMIFYKAPKSDTRPICVGTASSPSRGMMALSSDSCGASGWTSSGIVYAPL